MPLPEVPCGGFIWKRNYQFTIRCLEFIGTDKSIFLFSLTGKYGSEIRPAFWLNFLFLLMPVWGAVTLFTKPKDRPLIGGYNVSLAPE